MSRTQAASDRRCHFDELPELGARCREQSHGRLDHNRDEGTGSACERALAYVRAAAQHRGVSVCGARSRAPVDDHDELIRAASLLTQNLARLDVDRAEETGGGLQLIARTPVEQRELSEPLDGLVSVASEHA